jgi:hypothetical protein
METLTPNEVALRRERKKVESKELIEKSIDTDIESHADCVEVFYQSEGRFSTPQTMYFKSYSNSDINDIVLSKNEYLIETLIPILNKMKYGESAKDFDCAQMTIEEFIETLVAVKERFVSSKHKHPYMCECQYELPDNDQKLQFTEIELSKLSYRSITEAEENLKNNFKQNLEDLSEEEWGNYKSLYAKKHEIAIEDVTKESVVEATHIKEPLIARVAGQVLVFRLTRIADLVKAQKLADNEFNPKINIIKNRQEHGVPGTELQLKKQNEIELILKQKTKKVLEYTKAFSLISYADKILTDKEKLELINNRDVFNVQTMQDLNSLLDDMKYGVYQELEFTCPQCGKINKELLQHDLSLNELLPLNSKDERDNKQFTRLDICFGA